MEKEQKPPAALCHAKAVLRYIEVRQYEERSTAAALCHAKAVLRYDLPTESRVPPKH